MAFIQFATDRETHWLRGSLDQILQRILGSALQPVAKRWTKKEEVTFHPQAVYSVSAAMLYYCPFYDFFPPLLSVEKTMVTQQR